MLRLLSLTVLDRMASNAFSPCLHSQFQEKSVPSEPSLAWGLRRVLL